MSVNTKPQTDADESQIKQQFAAHFGDIEPDHADKYDFSGCVVGSENITMWMPDRKTDPNGFDLAEFESVESVGMYYAPVSDKPDNHEIQRVYAVRKGDRTHVINADNVDAVAEMVGQSAVGLLKTGGMMHTDYANYAVVADLPTGKAMFAPIAVGDDDLQATS